MTTRLGTLEILFANIFVHVACLESPAIISMTITFVLIFGRGNGGQGRFCGSKRAGV